MGPAGFAKVSQCARLQAALARRIGQALAQLVDDEEASTRAQEPPAGNPAGLRRGLGVPAPGPSARRPETRPWARMEPGVAGFAAGLSEPSGSSDNGAPGILEMPFQSTG